MEKDSIWIQNGKIIDPHKFFWHQKRLPDVVLDAHGLLVVPGFIEAQINGAFGVDFSVPLEHDTYEKSLQKVSRGLLKFGTTSYCPTIVSSSAEVYHKVLPHLKPRPGSVEAGATVLGAHVEGPFINEARIGAHELKVLQASAPNGYEDFKAVYGFEGETPEAQKKLSEEDLQSVKIITCAPELEGVMEAIPDLVKAGITVSVGHSMANTSQAEKAVMNGATFITHLFNAMPQFHHRDPGVIGLLGSRLDLPRPYYGLICDGIHVHPNSVKIAYDSHPEGVILVTDAMSAMGLAPGKYRLGNMNVTKEEDRVYIEKTDTLAGRASDDAHNNDDHGHRHVVADDKKEGTSKQDKVDRKLEIATTALNHSNNLTSPSDDVRIEQHDDGFLPTPPGSTPMSPLKMTPGSPGEAHPPTPLRVHGLSHANLESLATAYEWRIQYHPEYEEHTVYQDMEEHEGSEHSLRILTIHVADEDDNNDLDDGLDGVSTIHSSESYDTAGTQNDHGLESVSVYEHSHYSDNESIDHHAREDKPVDIALQTTTRHEDKQETIRLEMSDCSCHHTGGEERNGHNMQQEQEGTPTKARTPVIDDADLCCPSSSVITLDACIRNFIKFTHCSLVEALEAVTLHPAVLLGIQETKGVIKPGADADLVFLTEDLFVKRVFVAGEEVDLRAIDVEAIEKF